MEHEIIHTGANPMLLLKLLPGETVQAASGAMVAKTENVIIKGNLDGSAVQAIKRSILGGDTFFHQNLIVEQGEAQVLLAPAMPGEIAILDIDNDGGNEQNYRIKGGSFLASLGQVSIDPVLQKPTKGIANGLVSGEGLFILQTTGSGAIAICGFGGIHAITLVEGQIFLVDVGHIIAWTASSKYQIQTASTDWVASLTAGESTVLRFEGPAKIWLQTRNPDLFGGLIKTWSAGS